jgi:hypothetical protein
MGRTSLVLWVSFALALAACSGGGNGGTSSGTSSSSGGSSGGSPGSSGSSSNSSSGSGPGSSSSGSTGSSSSIGGVSSSGSSGGSSGGGSAGGSCTEPDDEPCQLTSGYGLCCLGTCTDPTSDPLNCGQCYNQCQGSQTCSQGSCTFANCDNAPNGALCAGNQGSEDPAQQCIDGVCVALTCAGAQGITVCGFPGDGGIGTCCQGQCSAFDDATNCGGCGIECPTGATCLEGTCSSTCADAGCPASTVCTQSFDNGLACISPSCSGQPDEQSCSAAGAVGGVCCNGGCTDTESDSQNCGQCYNFCQQGQLCVYGSCTAVVSSCAASQIGTLCQQNDGGLGACCGSCRQLDFETDSNNCGSCGVICSVGATCTGGQCALADGGYGQCDYNGNSCPAGDSCVSSSCVTQTCNASDPMEPCSSPGSAGGTAQCCGSACVDTNEDPANCGVCGNACSTGMFCLSGQCAAIPTCGPANSGTLCPLASGKTGTCCSSQCVDTESDSANCEGCGIACPVGEFCNVGSYPPCSLVDGGAAPSCYGGGAACPAGTVCSEQECLAPTCPVGASGGHCAFGVSVTGTCCNGVCADTTQDPDNCGTCGTTCASGVCYSSLGMPAQCLPGEDAGSCTGPDNPFGCAPGTTCLAGNCVTSSGCNGPFGNCQAGDGNIGACCQEFIASICSDLTSDAQNCGGCGVQCPSGQTCADGLCSGDVSPCGSGRRGAFCDLDAGTSLLCCAGGGCADVETDSANCGYCGYSCQPGLSCLQGQCLATSCTTTTAGEACVQGDGGLGGCCGTSCLDLGIDPDNCGGCGVKCASVESCVQGACVVPQCTPAHQGAPCDLDAGGGYLIVGSCCASACVNTQSDPDNCGLCGSSCGDAGCNNGSCQ